MEKRPQETIPSLCWGCHPQYSSSLYPDVAPEGGHCYPGLHLQEVSDAPACSDNSSSFTSVMCAVAASEGDTRSSEQASLDER